MCHFNDTCIILHIDTNSHTSNMILVQHINYHIFNSYFVSFTDALDLPPVCGTYEISNPIKISLTYTNFVSADGPAQLIMNMMQLECGVEFKRVSLQKVTLQIHRLGLIESYPVGTTRLIEEHFLIYLEIFLIWSVEF